MVAVALFGIFVLWGLTRPQPAQPASSSGGGGILVLLLVVVVVFGLAGAASLDSATSSIAVGGVEVQERADNHVAEKHGASAQDTLRRAPRRDYHYSASRETVMVSACDGTNCACMFVGVRGRNVTGLSGPQAIAGGLELSCYYMNIPRRAAVIVRDGYTYMGGW